MGRIQKALKLPKASVLGVQPLLIFSLSLAAASCDSNLTVQTSQVPLEEAQSASEEDNSGPDENSSSKLTQDGCIDPTLDMVPIDVTLTLCNGDLARGKLDLSSVIPENIKAGVSIAGVAGALVQPAPCSSDGDLNCITNVNYKAANMANFTAANIASGVTIAGVLGTGAGEAHVDCVSDGAVGCVTTATHKSANTGAYLSSDIKSGITIAGVAGSLGNCADGGSGCFVQGPTFKAAVSADLAAGNIKSGATIAGVVGSYGPACASDGAGACVVDGTTYKAAKLSNFVNTDVKSGVTIAGVAGSLGNCADGESGCVVQGPTFKAAASADLAASNIKSGVTIAGVAGSVTPSPLNCASDGASGCVVEGTNYIAADKTKVVNTNIKSGVSLGGVTGSYGHACASDGAGSCLVDGTTYKAALLANFSGADIETGVTIAGVAGSATLESHSNCASDGASGCVVEGTNYVAADKTKVVNTNIKSGVSLGGVTGNYAPACASDGAGPCLVDGTTYKAAAMANVVDSNIKTGVTIAGVAGNVTPSPGNCASDGASSCVVDGATYKAAATATAVAGNIKKGVAIAGVTGDYPSSTYPLAGANGSIDDLDSTTFNAKIKSSADFEWFDSIGNPYTHAGEPNIAAGLILNGVSIFGTVGSYVPGSISVSSLTATKGASKVALSWTRSGGSGVIVVRRAGASVSFTPTHGVNYAQGYTSGSDEVVYRGSAAAVDDTGVVDGTTYYYKAFAYNGDNAYSAASNEASVLYTDGEVCGGAGDNCYDDTAAKNALAATTPLGKNLVYVDNGNGFMVWKDAGSSKILRANGLDEWAMKLNLDGKGFQGAGNEFTDYTSLAGRKCPPSVYIDDGNKVSANNCLYYTVGYAAQVLNAAGTTQNTASTIGLNNWSNYNGGGAKWYVGNIKTCSDKGMRLPAVFETATTTTTNSYYPSDATPTFAGATNGIPSHASGYTWTASAGTYGISSYWRWSGASVTTDNYTVSNYVRCALP